MKHLEKAIEVDVPVRTAYNQWTQFEEFPLFMQGVKQVRQLDDKRLYWRAELGGHFEAVEWIAEITAQEPDKLISWRSTEGVINTGTVRFEELDSQRTRVILRLDYQPQGLGQIAGAAIGVVDNRVESDLERFKIFIETRAREQEGATGAWRGEIHGDEVAKPREMKAGERSIDP